MELGISSASTIYHIWLPKEIVYSANATYVKVKNKDIKDNQKGIVHIIKEKIMLFIEEEKREEKEFLLHLKKTQEREEQEQPGWQQRRQQQREQH